MVKINLQDFVEQTTTVTLGGKDFIFTRLNLDDYGKLYEWVASEKEATRDKRRSRIIEDAKKIEGADPIELLKYLDAPPTEEEKDAALGTVAGLAQMVMWSLRHTYEDITITEVKQIITIDDTVAVTLAMTGKIDEPEKKIAEKKTKPKKK